MTRHKHADLMIALANDKTLKIQFYSSFDHTWKDVSTPTWLEYTEYRIKPKTMKIGYFAVNEPEQDAPEHNTVYYFPSLGGERKYFDTVWCGSDFDYQMLKWNLVHLNKEDAIQHTKALIHVSGGII